MTEVLGILHIVHYSPIGGATVLSPSKWHNLDCRCDVLLKGYWLTPEIRKTPVEQNRTHRFLVGLLTDGVEG